MKYFRKFVHLLVVGLIIFLTNCSSGQEQLVEDNNQQSLKISNYELSSSVFSESIGLHLEIVNAQKKLPVSNHRIPSEENNFFADTLRVITVRLSLLNTTLEQINLEIMNCGKTISFFTNEESPFKINRKGELICYSTWPYLIPLRPKYGEWNHEITLFLDPRAEVESIGDLKFNIGMLWSQNRLEEEHILGILNWTLKDNEEPEVLWSNEVYVPEFYEKK